MTKHFSSVLLLHLFLRLVPPDEEETEVYTPGSLYAELEDGVLIEEMPAQQLMMPAQRLRRKHSAMDEQTVAGDSMFTSQTSFMSRRSLSPIDFNHSVVPMHSKGKVQVRLLSIIS